MFSNFFLSEPDGITKCFGKFASLSFSTSQAHQGKVVFNGFDSSKIYLHSWRYEFKHSSKTWFEFFYYYYFFWCERVLAKLFYLTRNSIMFYFLWKIHQMVSNKLSRNSSNKEVFRIYLEPCQTSIMNFFFQK